jgi:hypothetical protein
MTLTGRLNFFVFLPHFRDNSLILIHIKYKIDLNNNQRYN